jgi:hypothetical protein
MPLFTDAAPRLTSNTVTLNPGQVYLPPAGWYFVDGGKYGGIQRYDAAGQLWRYAGSEPLSMDWIYFDGISLRLANTTGCPVAAVVTNGGSGYTSPPTVTASAGSSGWTAILGGVVGTTMTIASGGGGYNYTPIVWIEGPSAPGVRATAVAVLTNGAITSITVVEQGAGYINTPVVAVYPDARDAAAVITPATISCNLVGSGTVAAVVCNNHGQPITSGTVPTLTFAGGGGSSAAATALMDWVVQSCSVSAAGAGYTSGAASVQATGAGGVVTTAPAYLGTETASAFVRYRSATINIATNSSGGLTTVSITDGGRYESVPTPAISSAQNYTTVGTLSFVMGGVNATYLIAPAQTL